MIPMMKDPDFVNLVGGAPLPSLFPIKSITVTLQDGSQVELQEADASLAQRYAPFAQGPLIEWCKQQVSALHKPPGPWDVQLTAGSMAGIDACLDNLFDRGDTILVEEFTFTAALDAIAALGLNVVTVPCDAGGLVPKELKRICEELGAKGTRPKGLLTIPAAQNPTGTRLRCAQFCNPLQPKMPRLSAISISNATNVGELNL
ncbi:hypothetical protein CYMTET_23831 [Cymbomonas tetramitiformis]|uniref:Aminotransferase class I/classII large domain-containing protein n=1 Tax=Cymbomonas tetramitiformis TaxID=36881 RepID=A0AAE0FXM0_9CHLO|nr:hypothetical protein CYMTET_23831 [Cymbomonas tetramitiformis]